MTKISERTKAGMARKKAQGKHMGRPKGKGVFIVILIGCSLAIMDQFNSVTNSTTISAASNVTSSSAEILSVIGGIISIFFALAIATTAILIAVSGIRNMGSV